MKVKDLEPVLQEMINTRYSGVSFERIAVERFLEIYVNWKTCTNEERIAECRRRYPKGTTFYPLNSNVLCEITTANFGTNELNGINELDSEGLFLKTKMDYHCLYSLAENKFAEIVTEEKAIHKECHITLPDLIKHDEQIRTELINELIAEFKKGVSLKSIPIETIVATLDTFLPTETPEKIAERKAINLICDNFDLTADIDRKYVREVIEALLTDIKK